MFNNRFNSTHKDPLVEAVRQAQQDGEYRRQAEAIVNEQFGVYSRQAVVRENLAAYDAAIEEAYADLKEGTPENIMNPNSSWAKKQAADKSSPFNQPTPNPTDVAPNIMIRGNTQGGSSSMVDKVKSLFKESGKKDEKKEDKPKSDYSKMREKMVGKGKDLETTRKIVGEAKKLADKDYDKDGKIESPKDEVWGSRFRAAKMAGKMEEGAVDAGSYEGSKSVTKSAPKEDPSTPKVPYSQLPKTGNRAGAVIDSAKGALKEYHLEEERKRTASVADAFMSGKKANQRTLKTDGQTVTYHGNTIAKHAGDEVHVTTAGHALSPSTRGHVNGILSRLGSPKLSVKKGQLHHGDKPVDHDAWIKVKKPEKATFNEAAYSAKSARAGKDIGKPGKMFAQIAAKAGAKYGSEERGKKVAGAILKRIRAKHMKEEQIDEIVVQKSQMRPGETLGQTMNRLTGKTAIKGGANDPSSPKFTGAKTVPSVPKTNTPGTQGVAVGKSFADIDRKKMTASATDDMASKATAKAFFKPGADPNAPKNVPNSQTASMPANERPTPPSASAVKAGLPPRRPENLGVPAAPQPGAPKSDASAGVKKVMATMNEEVQIGDYKYRII